MLLLLTALSSSGKMVHYGSHGQKCTNACTKNDDPHGHELYYFCSVAKPWVWDPDSESRGKPIRIKRCLSGICRPDGGEAPEAELGPLLAREATHHLQRGKNCYKKKKDVVEMSLFVLCFPPS